MVDPKQHKNCHNRDEKSFHVMLQARMRTVLKISFNQPPEQLQRLIGKFKNG
jgi:hypothetical protein